MANLRVARMYEGDTAPSPVANPSSPAPFWLDTSGAAPVLKVRNAAGDDWAAVDTDTAVLAKLTALDAAATAIGAIATDLDETVAKADIDDAGTIDGTEIAAAFSVLNARVNDIAGAVNALVTAFQAAG